MVSAQKQDLLFSHMINACAIQTSISNLRKRIASRRKHCKQILLLFYRSCNVLCSAEYLISNQYNMHRPSRVKGSLLLAAVTKGERLSLSNARVTVYQPLGGYSGQAKDMSNSS